MTYSLTGAFIEACDCMVICPCWVGGLPDNGSCTGFFAWSITGGTIDGVPVDGGKVVSVSTHLGARTGNTGATAVAMLFVDAHSDARAKLAEVFTGGQGGPVADIIAAIAAAPVVPAQTATITVVPDTSVEVTVGTDTVISTDIEPVVGASGRQVTVHDQSLDPSVTELKVARNTAIDIRVDDPAGGTDGLPATYLFDFTRKGYSASSGQFTYEQP